MPPRQKPNALVASAKMLTAERLNQPKTAAWQEECWGHYDLQGELWFACLWRQNAFSKIRLFAATPPLRAGDEPTPIESGPAVDLMEQFAGGVAGQGTVLASTSVHLDVVGEGFLVGQTDEEETSWVICSNDELKVVKNNWAMKLDAKTWAPLPEESLVIRIWRQHARRKWLADSPTRHALGALREIQRCNEHIDATLVSRLAGSGLLIMPNEVSFPHTEASEGKDDPFFYELLEAMRAPIKDRGVAGAVVPLPVRVPGDQVANFKHLTFDTKLDEKVLALRVNAIERFATTVDFPSDILLGKGDLNHWPCASDTSVFTRDRGFVTHDQLNAGDLVLSLDHETGMSEWVPLSGVRREHVTDREMVRVNGPSVDALTTLDHRWPILRDGRRIWTSGVGLSPEDRIIRAVPHADRPLSPKYADAFVELVAWYSADGTAIGTTPQVRIGKSHKENPDKVAELRRIFTDLFGPAHLGDMPKKGLPRSGDPVPRWREDRQARGMTLFCPNKAASVDLLAIVPDKMKVVPRGFVLDLTQAQLLLFLNAFARADGTLRPNGGFVVDQRVPERLEAVALAAVLAGRPIQFSTQERTTGFKDGTQHYLNVPIMRGYDVPCGETTRERYTGVIFCPQVPPTKSFLARRNGKVYFTGNTSWQISEEGLQMHIEPGVELICDAYTKGYLKPALASMGEDTNAMIWYDTSELAVRPDRSADAKWAFADAIIGPHAVIRETGFTEADRPTTEEFEEMVGWKLLGVRGGAALALALLKVDYDPALLPPDEGGTGPVSPVQPGQDPGLVGPDTAGPDSPGTKPPSPIQGPPSAGSPSPGPDLPSQAATLLVADQLVYRALERSGNRLRSLRKGKLTADEDCPPASMHQCLDWRALGIKPAELLEGAWARVPEAAEALGEDPVKMQRALQRYCVQLYEMGKQGDHSVERLAEFLADELPPSMAALVAAGDGMQMGLVREMSRSMARLTETLSKQPAPVIHVATPAPEIRLDGPVSVTNPPRSRRLERDADGNLTRIVEEEGPAPAVSVNGSTDISTAKPIPPRVKRVERDKDGNMTRIVEED